MYEKNNKHSNRNRSHRAIYVDYKSNLDKRHADVVEDLVFEMIR